MNISLNKNWGRALCTIILISIIASHELLYVKLALWLLLGFVCLCDPGLAVDSVFFFAAFFVGTGFFQNSLVTIKHFHIALAILLFVSFVKWNWTRWKQKENWRPSMVLMFWIVLIALSIFSLWWVGEGLTKGVRTNGNLFLTFLCGSLLSILITPEEAMRGLGFLAFGTCTRAAFGLLAFCKLPGPYVKEVILYNNHIGFYCTIALLCLLPFVMISRDRVAKWFSVIAFYFLFSVLLFSCSRTGYISFVGGLIAFLILQKWLGKKGFAGSKQRDIWLLLLSGCLGGVLILLIAGYFFPLAFLFPIISSRLWMTLIVFVPSYWHRFHKENFYFLGHYRLEQFQVLGEIIKQHLIFGVGLAQRVTDFHCLYFTLLGGTGVVGLLTFLGFCVSWIRQLLQAMVPDNGKGNMFRVVLLSCMVVWLFYSFAESFFLFFNIWVVIAAGIALSKKTTVERELSHT